LGVIDGSISYLYSTIPLNGIPSATPSIPLRSLVRGYHDINLPPVPAKSYSLPDGERKPTLLHATLALPPPSVLTALYMRRINPRTFFSLSLNSKSTNPSTASSSPPPASVLAHIQHDTGQYRVEALGSTDSALLGLRGLWNFGYPKHASADQNLQKELLSSAEGLSNLPVSVGSTAHQFAVQPKPSLLSAGAEVYYSPLSSVIGLSTGLRFTTLPQPLPVSASAISPKPLAGTSATLSSAAASTLSSTSSFPYTMTLIVTPLTGSLASTYSIKPTQNLALSSRFGFNVYSWESEYVLGAEIWRQHHKPKSTMANPDALNWARDKAAQWLDAAQTLLLLQRSEEEEKLDESVIRLRIDDSWNIRALWTGRVKDLLISAGVNLSPISTSHYRYQMAGSGVSGGGAGFEKRWKGSVGVEVAYSS
jgi:mitochondrial distribution and morphology protein 10